MTSVVIAMFLKPFVALILLGCICLPVRLLVQKLPNSWFKRLLLIRITDSPGSSRSGENPSESRVLGNEVRKP